MENVFKFKYGELLQQKQVFDNVLCNPNSVTYKELGPYCCHSALPCYFGAFVNTLKSFVPGIDASGRYSYENGYYHEVKNAIAGFIPFTLIEHALIAPGIGNSILMTVIIPHRSNY